MNDNAKKWVKVLRSGEYPQGTCYLNRDGKFCCLGVACELYQKETGALTVRENNSIVTYQGLDGALPNLVKDWLGLSSVTGSFYELNITESLAGKNDSGFSFNEIADIIESEPKGLFQC